MPLTVPAGTPGFDSGPRSLTLTQALRALTWGVRDLWRRPLPRTVDDVRAAVDRALEAARPPP